MNLPILVERCNEDPEGGCPFNFEGWRCRHPKADEVNKSWWVQFREDNTPPKSCPLRDGYTLVELKENH